MLRGGDLPEPIGLDELPEISVLSAPPSFDEDDLPTEPSGRFTIRNLREPLIISAGTSSTGDSGNVNIKSTKLDIRDGVQISVGSTSSGNAGDISIESEKISLIGGDAIDSGLFSNAVGLFSSSTGNIESGNIKITANESLILDNVFVSVETTDSNAGDIIFSTNNLLKLSNSELTTSVEGGEGSGGNIVIGQQSDDNNSVLSPDLIVLDNSLIKAQAAEGVGGKIDITADLIFKSGSSVVDASSKGGINGTVNINSPETNLSGSLIVLPESYLSASDHLSAHCSARAANISSFMIKDRGGIPPGPDDAASSVFYGDDSYQELSEDRLSTASPDPIVLNHPRNINAGLAIAESGCDK